MNRYATRASMRAVEDATRYAKSLGHAAAVIVFGPKRNPDYDVVDSWKPIPEGWEVAWLVSASGKVVSAT